MEIDKSKSRARICAEIIYDTDSCGYADSCKVCAYDGEDEESVKLCVEGSCVDGVEQYLEVNPITIEKLTDMIVRGGSHLYDQCDYCIFVNPDKDADLTEICHAPEGVMWKCHVGVLEWLKREGFDTW